MLKVSNGKNYQQKLDLETEKLKDLWILLEISKERQIMNI